MLRGRRETANATALPDTASTDQWAAKRRNHEADPEASGAGRRILGLEPELKQDVGWSGGTQGTWLMPWQAGGRGRSGDTLVRAPDTRARTYSAANCRTLCAAGFLPGKIHSPSPQRGPGSTGSGLERPCTSPEVRSHGLHHRSTVRLWASHSTSPVPGLPIHRRGAKTLPWKEENQRCGERALEPVRCGQGWDLWRLHFPSLVSTTVPGPWLPCAARGGQP